MRTLLIFVIIFIFPSYASDKDFSDDKDINVFFNAVHDGDSSTVVKLVQNGLNVNSINKYDKNALQVPYFSDNLEMFILLIRLGADINYCTPKQKMCVLHDYVSPGKLKFVKKLVEAGVNLNEQDGVGSTALLTAGSLNQFDIAYYLIQSGADIHIGNNWGKTIVDRINESHISEESEQFIWLQKTKKLIEGMAE